MDLQAVGLNIHHVSLDGSYRETTNCTQRQDYEDHLLDNPVFNIVCDSSFDLVMRRSQCLEMNFHRMETLFPSEVQDLLRYYHKITADIEMDKLTAVMNSTKEHYQRLNNHYNHQRHRLIRTMEERLHVLENQNKTPYLCKDVNWKAFTLMQVWFNKNIHHPYPSNKDIQEISKNGNISEGDVLTWFRFERIKRRMVISQKVTC